MFEEVWSDEFVVNHDASVILDGSHAPDEENALDQPVEWDDLADVEREELDDREGRENHPISQPFGVVCLVLCLDGFHRHVSRVGDSNDIAENLSSVTEGKVQGNKADESWKQE